MKWTMEHIEALHRSGKIQGFTVVGKQTEKTVKNIPTKKQSKTKEWIKLHLKAWAGAKGIELVEEHKFHPERKWRFDFCFPELKIGIEYEGLMSRKSRHTTVTGFTGDADKYNAAQQLGWIVLRYTALNYTSIITDLNKLS